MAKVTHRYAASVDAAYQALIDPDHLRRRAEDAGEKNISVTVEERGGATVVNLTRDIESEIPSFAKKFVDAVNRVESIFEWRADGESRRATYTANVSKRITVRGSITLVASGDGCEHTETFEPTVDMPLIGKKVASLVSEKTETAVRAACRFTERDLS